MSTDRPPEPPSIVILISGRGSNMRALVEYGRTAAPPPYRVALVLSDKAEAAGLGVARGLSIATKTLTADRSLDRAGYDRLLAAIIDEAAPALIVLAGFMRILSPGFVARYAGRILNIHPSLLPKHRGLHTHRGALAAREPEHGATVHFVTAELDGGPPVIQGRVPILPLDDESTLAARVQTLEHRIYPLAVRWFCEGRLSCREAHAWLDGVPLTQPVPYEFPAAPAAPHSAPAPRD